MVAAAGTFIFSKHEYERARVGAEVRPGYEAT